VPRLLQPVVICLGTGELRYQNCHAAALSATALAVAPVLVFWHRRLINLGSYAESMSGAPAQSLVLQYSRSHRRNSTQVSVMPLHLCQNAARDLEVNFASVHLVSMQVQDCSWQP
jgi:hypothetical protein